MCVLKMCLVLKLWNQLGSMWQIHLTDVITCTQREVSKWLWLLPMANTLVNLMVDSIDEWLDKDHMHRLSGVIICTEGNIQMSVIVTGENGREQRVWGDVWQDWQGTCVWWETIQTCS